jgi:lipoate-protein ligase A
VNFVSETAGRLSILEENDRRDCWRLLDVEYENPYINMALEEAITKKVGEQLAPNTIRFWRNQNSVVVGRFQSVMSEVNLDACRRYKTDIVRRFTGGGSVYHDSGNLNYSVYFHVGHRLFRNDFIEVYNAVAQAVIEGLKILGVSAEFESPSSIRIGDFKISGLAGAIKWGAVLCHGSLLVDSNLKILEEVLAVDTGCVESKYVTSVRRKVITLSTHLKRSVSVQEVKEALKLGFENCFLIRLVPGKLTEEELYFARKLCKEKYSQKWSLQDP